MDHQIEKVFGDTVLRLDGNVLEIMNRTAYSKRIHVAYASVEVKERRHGEVRFTVGNDVNGRMFEGNSIDVPPERVPEMQAFFAEARRRRDALGA